MPLPLTTSPLVELGRLSPAGRSLLETSISGLVTAPHLDRRLPVRPPSAPRRQGHPAAHYPATWWLLGGHGGAGVTSLRRAGVSGADAERRWPTSGAVVVVVRRSGVGLEWARDAARQHASGGLPDAVLLVGLVIVADAPGRPPTRLARFLHLVSGAYPRVWEVPWVEEWRLAGHAEPVPMPRAARNLDTDMQALVGAGTARAKE
ncbi:MAG: DUF6668 family protein [Mycobacteriales bacterium]